MYELGIALGLVFVIEGLAYAIFPAPMRTMLKEVVKLPPEKLRTVGIISLVLGALVVWAVVRFGA